MRHFFKCYIMISRNDYGLSLGNITFHIISCVKLQPETRYLMCLLRAVFLAS